MMQRIAYQKCILPANQDNATYTAYALDCVGKSEIALVFYLGVTDVSVATMKLQESDTLTDATTLATGTDVTGLIVGTSTDPLDGTVSALPSDTADGGFVKFSIKNQGRKRYLNPVVVAGNGTTGTILGAHWEYILEDGPQTAAQHGLLEHLAV